MSSHDSHNDDHAASAHDSSLGNHSTSRELANADSFLTKMIL